MSVGVLWGGEGAGTCGTSLCCSYGEAFFMCVCGDGVSYGDGIVDYVCHLSVCECGCTLGW